VESAIEREAEDRMQRLERLYHKGQDLVWDGRAVLAELIAKHGKPRLPAHARESALKLLSVLLWGELAAWAISADLAERIEDVEAKMAATSQAHDEARHFYVFRDYLRELGEPVPRLGGIGRQLLVGILESDSLVHKLIGMQLLVESNALTIFKGLRHANIDPVLSELLPYYERDEARHVGLGVMYLPRLLEGLSRVEAARVSAFQLRCVGMLISAGLPMRRDLEALGIDPRKLAAHTVELQDEIFGQMRASAREQGADRFRGLGGLMNPRKGFGPAVLDCVHPVGGMAAAPPMHRAVLELWLRGAEIANRAWA
jgi:rubrerythrin